MKSRRAHVQELREYFLMWHLFENFLDAEFKELMFLTKAGVLYCHDHAIG